MNICLKNEGLHTVLESEELLEEEEIQEEESRGPPAIEAIRPSSVSFCFLTVCDRGRYGGEENMTTADDDKRATECHQQHQTSDQIQPESGPDRTGPDQ
ncbi:unnamed protein product [Arctogadus glacialis]